MAQAEERSRVAQIIKSESRVKKLEEDFEMARDEASSCDTMIVKLKSHVSNQRTGFSKQRMSFSKWR